MNTCVQLAGLGGAGYAVQRWSDGVLTIGVKTKSRSGVKWNGTKMLLNRIECTFIRSRREISLFLSYMFEF